jgi:hypothetical protein
MMAPDKGLSSSFKRNVHLDLNKSCGWKTPAEQWPHIIEAWNAGAEAPHYRIPVVKIVPTLVCGEMLGVQPMVDPQALVFSMRTRYAEDK